MNEQLELIRNYTRMVWRYRWMALLSASVLCAAGWLSILLLPNQFEAQAKIYIDTESILRPLLKGLAPDAYGREDTASMIQRTLLVRPTLADVARDTDLDIRARSAKDFEHLLINLASSIDISGSNRSNVYVIAYKNSDPKLAFRVVESLVSNFQEKALGDTRRDTRDTRTFLEAQIGEHESRLRIAEERLKEFKRENVGRMPSEGRNYFSRLEGLRASLAEAELQLSEAKNRVASIEQQLAREQPTVVLPGDDTASAHGGAPTPYDERIAMQESNLDTLLLQYTDQHPDVVSTRRLIDELKGKRKTFLAERRKQTADEAPGQTAARLMGNPIYSELTLAYAEAMAEAAAMETRVSEYRRREAELGKLIDTIPQVEAEFARLNRDYEVIKGNYEALVERLESLKIADQAERTDDSGRFDVIDPPREPLVPVSPDRPKLSIAVLVAGLAGGVGITVLFSLLRPAIYTREALRGISELPVFGVVSRLWTPRERFKRRMEVATFGVGCLCLFAIFAGLIAMYQLNLDAAIIAKLERLAQQYL